ncbi:OprO/OprP family phosphate-selective porin [Brevundimonas nasdae]|uniref:Porin n=1 Tax=Brevundimonas nasdae TaxID=172043 RepID=A0ACD4VJN1_9CAUL|nr:porin [Brevundimonas nasdae]WOB78139.1 porin [Brevundimonas nasdae]
MTIYRSLAAGVGLAALATSAFAQSAPSADEIAALRAQVQALSARLEQLEAQSRTAAVATPTAVAGTPAPVAAPRPVQTAAAPAPATPAPVDWATGLPEWRSPDGAFTFKPRIRVTADLSTTFGSDYPNRDLTTTELRGLRLGGQGKIAGGFSYWIEGDIADNSVSVANAFIAYSRKLGGRDLEISAGQRLNDRGVEGGTAEDQTPFLERSLMVSTIGPERGSYGVGVMGKLTGSVWHASLSVTGDAISDGTTSDTVAVMGRTHWSAFKTEAGFLHLGGWGFVEDLTPVTTLSSRNLVVSSRGNDNLRLSSGAYANPKSSSGLGLEFGVVHRSFWAMAEGGKRVVRTAARDFDQDAYSLSAGLFLTGETPPLSARTGTWTRPKVLNPLGVDGYGAVEIVGRYDTADFTDSLTGGEGDTWLLGVNWYPTNNTRVSAHWSAWSVDNRTGAFTGEDNGNTATVRVQTAF